MIPKINPSSRLLAMCALVSALFFQVQLAALDYEVKVAGEPRQATVNSVEMEGVEYISLDAFCKDLGGTCEAIASQMRLSLAGKSAVMLYGESEVHSSLGSFMLSAPIRRFEDSTYIARKDLPDFLKKAFDIEAQESTNLAPITPEMEVPASEVAGQTQPPANDAVALKATVIVLDAGHGGRDAGFSASNGLTEKDLTLKLSERVLALLKEKTDAKLYGTRREDVDLSNSDRVRIANENSGSLFISLHAGVSRSTLANGIDLYITDEPIVAQANVTGTAPQRDSAKSVESSRALAQAIAGQIEALGVAKVRGVRQAPLRLLNEVAMPGLLIEVGYLSNTAEAELLQQDAHLDKLAQAIVAGIEQATQKEKPAP